MKILSYFFLLLFPLILNLSCWDDTTSPEDKIIEPIKVSITAVKDSSGTLFETKNDSSAIPEKSKLLYVKALDLDYIDSIGAFYYTGQSLEIGEKISIPCDALSDSIINIGSLAFSNTGTYKVFYYVVITDSTNVNLVDTINFVVGGVAPKITANDTTDTIFTIQELKTLQIGFKALGQYSSSKPYFSSITDMPYGATFDSITGMFFYTPDTSIALKDSNFVLPPITITASDNSIPTVSNTFSFTVTVTDSTKVTYPNPVITITGGDTVNAYVNEKLLLPEIIAYDSTLGDISDSVKIANSVDTSSIGIYEVIISVTGKSEVTVSETLTVSVLDTVKPTITISGNNPLIHYIHTSFNEPVVSANDNNDGNISTSILKLGTVDTSIIGFYKISYDVSDSSSNFQTDTLVVNVVDTTPPVITLLGNSPDTVLFGGGAYSDPGATALDNADGLITFDKFTATGVVNKDSLGIYTRTYNVSDASGNAAIALTRTIVVLNAPDTTAPIVMINGGDKNDTVWVGDSYTLPIAMASDNKDGMIGNDAITKNPATAVTTTAGTFEFIYSATDAASNVGYDTLTLVVVADTIAPVITILGKEKDTINVGDSYTSASAVAIDNKDDTVKVTKSGTWQNTKAGTNIITYTATDAAGNESTKLVIVVVKDIAPQIAVQPRDTSIDIEKTVTFKVEATGTNLEYQWQKNGVDISQAVFSEYTTPAISKGDTNSVFTCVVSNTASSITSDGADLTPVWFVAASGGQNHSNFLKSDGTLWACGANSQGQFHNDGEYGSFPNPIKILEDVRYIPYKGACLAIKNDNTLWVNNNSKYPFGITPAHQAHEQAMTGIKKAHWGSNFVIEDLNGKIWATGRYVGDSTTDNKSNPVEVKISGEIIKFDAGAMYIKSDNTLWSAGYNWCAQFGTGDSNSILVPKQIKTNIFEVSHGGQSSFYIDSDNNLYGTGWNRHGQLGLNDSTDRIKYTFIESGVLKVWASTLFTIILKNDGKLYGAGLNDVGQLGLNNQTKMYAFTELDIAGEIESVSIGYKHIHIVKKDGTLWATGDNGVGQLGDGSKEDKLSPVKITF